MELVTNILVLTLMSCYATAAGRRPNILMLMIDDLRPDLGCYNHPQVKTPNIDKLSTVSSLFYNSHAQVSNDIRNLSRYWKFFRNMVLKYPLQWPLYWIYRSCVELHLMGIIYKLAFYWVACFIAGLWQASRDWLWQYAETSHRPIQLPHPS